MSTITSIDLGSNSFRVLIYDCVKQRSLLEYHEVVGMADGLIETGLISNSAQERVEKAIFKASKKLKFNPKEAICVTTAAMRKAKNSKEVLRRFEKNTGAKFSIIEGSEEARLTLLAVKTALKREKINDEKFILLDIGGGSTEIIINTKENYVAKSFDFGIVTLTQLHYGKKDLHDYLEEKKQEIKAFFEFLNISYDEYTFVATAGTPTTIAALKLGQDFFHYDKEKVNGTCVNLKDLADCLDLINTSSKEELIILLGKGRVEFIEVGIYIYQAIFEVFNKKESIVLDDGLREGVAINHCLLSD